MKKIILISLLSSISLGAINVGLNPKQNFATPMKQLQAKYQKAAMVESPEKSSEFVAETQYTPRGLLIFLDEPLQNCNKQALSAILTDALIQKAGPIVVSANLLKSILKNYFLPEEKTVYIRVIHFLRSFLDPETLYDPCTRLFSYGFDSNEWVIKEASSDLYLMLPHAYLSGIDVSASEVKQQAALNVTATELKLGLKVNHMRSVSIKEIKNSPRVPQIDTSHFVYDLYQEKLFCDHSDYNDRKVAQPLWTWFISGHGLFGTSIVGMSIVSFKKILDFASTKINMRLFMYQSCYSAGLNTELIYNDEKTNIKKTYLFPIVTQAIADAPTSKIIVAPGDKVSREDDYYSFIKLAHEQDMDYKKIINCLFHTIPNKDVPGNIAQIKLPGIEWFSTVGGKNDIVTIGTVMVKTRTNALDIEKFFKADPKALLLEASYVPFEVIINTPSLEYIISMIPGESYSYIYAINSQVHTINKILEWFQRVETPDLSLYGLRGWKMLYISRINALNETGKLTEYKDILMLPSRTIYFKQGSDIFLKQPGNNLVNASREVCSDTHELAAFPYTQVTFDKTKKNAQEYSKKINVRATENTEGLSSEGLSKLDEFLKTHREKRLQFQF